MLTPCVSAASLQVPGIYSASGFDLLGALARIATRPKPVVHLGPVDLSCAFLVSDARKPDNPIVYVSPTFEILTGYKSSEILGLNCRFLQDPSGDVQPGSNRKFSDNNIIRKLKLCVESQGEGQFTLINYKKNGEPFMNHLTIIPIAMGHTSEITHFVGLQIDIVDQPQAILERMRDGTYMVNYQTPNIAGNKSDPNFAIEFSNLITENPLTPSGSPGFLNSFIDTLPDFIHIVSFRGMFMHVSPEAAMKVLEYSREELLGHNISEFMHPADLVSVMRELRTCSSGGTINYICRLKRKKSGYIYMEMNGRMYLGGKRTRCFIVSGRERRFPELYIDKTQLSDSIDQETWLKLSSEGLILFAPSDACNVFGRSSDSMICRRITDFVIESEQTQICRWLEMAVKPSELPDDVRPSPHVTTTCTIRQKSKSVSVQMRFYGYGTPEERKVYCQVAITSSSPLSDMSPTLQAARQPTSLKNILQAESALHEQLELADQLVHQQLQHQIDQQIQQLQTQHISTMMTTESSPSIPDSMALSMFNPSPEFFANMNTISESANHQTQSPQMATITPTEQPTIDSSTLTNSENIFQVMEAVRVTSHQFEINKLRINNKRLLEEIEAATARLVSVANLATAAAATVRATANLATHPIPTSNMMRDEQPFKRTRINSSDADP